MPQYAALTFTRDVDWTAPEQAGELADWDEFRDAAMVVIRGGAVQSTSRVKVRAAYCGMVTPGVPRPVTCRPLTLETNGDASEGHLDKMCLCVKDHDPWPR